MINHCSLTLSLSLSLKVRFKWVLAIFIFRSLHHSLFLYRLYVLYYNYRLTYYLNHFSSFVVRPVLKSWLHQLVAGLWVYFYFMSQFLFL